MGKNIEIFGENEKTILVFDGSKTDRRDGAVMEIENSNTIVRNLTYVYYPKSGSDYQRSIFRWCNGTVENVFFRICGPNSASYLYNNDGGSIRVNNCTFFHDLGSVESNYSGNCKFTNIATNVNTSETRTNVIVDNFGTKDNSLTELIGNSKTNTNFVENSAGVFYGEHSWSKTNKIFFIKSYQLNYRNTFIKIGETIKSQIIGPEDGGTINISDWTWTSSNEDVATVDKNGNVMGKGIGYTTITAYNSAEEVKAKAIVNVYRNKEGAITKPQIEVGPDYSVILKEDGTVWTTGRNNYGQLGNGTTTNSNKPVQVKIDENTYLTNIRKISATDTCVVALATNGEVYAWGRNNYRQLGQGDTTNCLYAKKVKTEDGTGYIQNIIDVIANNSNTVYLDKNGGLYICGYSSNGIFLEKTASTKGVTYLGPKNAIKITGGYINVGLITTTGKAVAWGQNDYGTFGAGNTSTKETIVAYDVNDFKIACYGSIVLKEDGKAYAAGKNSYGQLGIGNTTNTSILTQISIDTNSKIKYIAPGGDTSAVMTSDGTVYETGYNNYGVLSNGTTTNSAKFMPLLNNDGSSVTDGFIIPEKIIDSSTDFYPTIFSIIKKDGTVWTSGNNEYGQLGNSTNINSKYLTQTGTINVELNRRKI